MSRLNLTFESDEIQASLEKVAANQPIEQYELIHSVATDKQIIEAALMILGPLTSALSENDADDGAVMAMMITVHTLLGATLLADEEGEILDDE